MIYQPPAELRSRALQLFFKDGRSDGMRTAEIFNWSGHVLISPRTRIGEALKRTEARYTGVYLLTGDKDGEACVYIGEAIELSERIGQHASKKDWWNTAVMVTTSANNLNKAHVMFLEACLLEQAQKVDEVIIDNDRTPNKPELSEPDEANMKEFLDYTFMVLPAIGIDCFIRRTRPPTKETGGSGGENETQEFELFNRKNNITANARLENGEFIVVAGSRARSSWASQQSEHTYARLHSQLLRTGVIEEREDSESLTDQSRIHVFREDCVFQSPSAAAAVVNGRPANGRTEWKIRGQDTTYEQWERAQLDSLEI